MNLTEKEKQQLINMICDPSHLDWRLVSHDVLAVCEDEIHCGGIFNGVRITLDACVMAGEESIRVYLDDDWALGGNTSHGSLSASWVHYLLDCLMRKFQITPAYLKQRRLDEQKKQDIMSKLGIKG